jgi:anti-sigma factor ChrR (cupin superfamily)
VRVCLGGGKADGHGGEFARLILMKADLNNHAMSSYVLRLPETSKQASKRIAAAVFIAKADKAWAKVGSKQPMPDDRWTKT